MKLKKTLALLLALATLAGCSAQGPQSPSDSPDMDNAFIEQTPVIEIVDIEDEAVALSDAPAPAASIVLKPVASGTQTQSSGQATIDYSNAKDGYVMVKASSGKKLMVRVFGPSYAVNETKYTYTLPSGEWTTFPLSDGNGDYKVTVYENVSGTSYSTMLSASFSVTLTDEFAPFLRPNQYVNFTENSKAVAKGAELCQGITDNLKKVEKIYDYVVNNLTYDTQKAASVQSGYLPNVDAVMDSGKGICFDYAALMASMLRSQEVPCKLVVGYTGDVYHAWINVWSEEDGWVEGLIYFDGKVWKLMDPTFASSGNQSNKIMEYIGNGANYKAKYLY